MTGDRKPGLAAVVPAAGLSRRMGKEKVLLPFGRSTVLETILETLAAAGVAEVVTVLRPDLTEAAERARRLGARVVFNPHPEEEMLESIRLGLREVAPEAPGAFLWPADHPAVSAGTIATLSRFAHPALALIPCWQSRRGHPALIGRKLFSAITEIPPREGLRHLWRTHSDAVVEFSVEDPGTVQNVDTPEDYRKALERKPLGS
jgi:CTP:molybdopterin cytidylyltransferase MocA